ncbi:MAG: AraC family transcriptional regulator [Acidobacteriota bacterium]
MREAVLSMLAAACLACLFASLLLRRSRPVDQNAPLAGLFLVLTLVAFDGLGSFVSAAWSTTLSGVSLPAFSLFGPLLLLHVQRVDGTGPNRRAVFRELPRSALAFTGFCFLAFGACAFAGPAWPPRVFALLYLGVLTWTSVFLLRAGRRIRVHDLRLESWFSAPEDRSLAWIRHALLFPSLLVVLDLLLTLLAAVSGTPNPWSAATFCALALTIVWFAYVAIAHRALPRPLAAEPTAAEISEQTKYAKSGIGQREIDEILRQLDAVVQQESLHLEAQVSLPVLAERIGVSTNHLSQALNQGRGQTFFDYIHGLRIEEACRRLETTADGVLEIALATGYRSKSTFNAAFKKYTKTTPSGYRSALKSGDSNQGGDSPAGSVDLVTRPR